MALSLSIPSTSTLLEASGWLANACFFSRFFVQWAISERSASVRTPRVFWQLSLLGSALLAGYLIYKGESVLLVGVAINTLIYWRNLQLGEKSPEERAALAPASMSHPWLVRIGCVAGGLLLVAVGFTQGAQRPAELSWLVWSVVAQGLWSSRFMLQWWFAERRGHSHLPPTFWWVSLLGNGMLLAYAVHRGDAVLIAGLSVGPLVQVRNLVLGRRSVEATSVSRAAAGRSGLSPLSGAREE